MHYLVKATFQRLKQQYRLTSCQFNNCIFILQIRIKTGLCGVTSKILWDQIQACKFPQICHIITKIKNQEKLEFLIYKYLQIKEFLNLHLFFVCLLLRECENLIFSVVFLLLMGSVYLNFCWGRTGQIPPLSHPRTAGSGEYQLCRGRFSPSVLVIDFRLE